MFYHRLRNRNHFYTIYNKLSDGDFNEKYYVKKNELGNNISINEDFAGKNGMG